MASFKTRIALSAGSKLRVALGVEGEVAGLGLALDRITSRLRATQPAPARTAVRPRSRDARWLRGTAARAELALDRDQENAAKRQQDRDRRQNQLARKDRTIAELRTQLAEARRAAHSSTALQAGLPLFFLVGHAKSGTSWLMRTLHSHPEVYCRGEGKFFGEDSPRSLQGVFAGSEALQKWLRSSPWVQHPEAPQEELMRFVVNAAMGQNLRRRGIKIVGDKTPLMTAGLLREAKAVCPGSKIVHIVRDGRDVAVSSVHHRWNHAGTKDHSPPLRSEERASREAYRSDPDGFLASGGNLFGGDDIGNFARVWSTKVTQAIADGTALFEEDYHQLRYEDLLTDPVRELQSVLTFLGVDSSTEAASKCSEAASFESLSGRERGREESTSFYRKGVAGDWRRYFTAEHRQAFSREAGELLVRLGYEDAHD